MSDECLMALAGWFTLENGRPQLIGSRCITCGTYYFPRLSLFCRNPACQSQILVELPLSSTGRIWSFTNACYQPPEPFIAPDPFEPFAIAAVELAAERMIVLGQVASGFGIEQLSIGMSVELVVEPLYIRDGVARLIWKWKPSKEAR